MARRRVKHRGRRLALAAAAVALPAFAAPVEWNGEPHLSAASASPLQPMAMVAATTQQTDAGASAPSAFLKMLDTHFQAGLASASRLVQISSDLPDPGPAARPLVAGGSVLSQARALNCLTQAIYYEAASESEGGQRAVAQVVLNRVLHPQYPDTVCGVVFQGSSRKTGCQFTFTCDGSLARRPAALAWSRARRIAEEALAGTVYGPVGLATHYHTIWINPYWASSLTQVTTIGAHRFYRWRGAAGTPAAFRSAYLAAEPEPTLWTSAPAGRDASATLATFTPAAGPAPSAAASARTPEIAAPNYVPEIKARGGDAIYSANNLPGGGEVRPEFARSGQWLEKP